MIARARKAIPGMLVSLLLTIPAAAHADLARTEMPASPLSPASGRAAAGKAELRKPGASRRGGLRLLKSATPGRTSRPVIGAPPVWSASAAEPGQVGKASWYGGPRWQGRPTSGGGRYDERELTAAHATLPLGSKVKVTVSDSGRSVVVVINDRPGTRTRIIDLSRAAAAELGMLNRGVAMVALEPQ